MQKCLTLFFYMYKENSRSKRKFNIYKNVIYPKIQQDLLQSIKHHLFGAYAKVKKKLKFLTPWYAHVRVLIKGLEMLVFRKILRMYKMDGLLSNTEIKWNTGLQ